MPEHSIKDVLNYMHLLAFREAAGRREELTSYTQTISIYISLRI